LTPLSKPQQPQALIYLVGLLWIIRFRSLRECAQQFGHGRFERLQHFVSQGATSAQALQHQMQRWLARLAPDGAPLLVLDDTACPRAGPAIEGVGWHHSAQGLVRGVCAVTAMLKVGPHRFVWAVCGYRPQKNCPRGQFHSKIEWAVQIVAAAKEFSGCGRLTVLMDSWYACARLLNAIAGAGWTYVAALRSNRIVYVRGRKPSVRSLAKSRRGSKTVRVGRRRFRVSRHGMGSPVPHLARPVSGHLQRGGHRGHPAGGDSAGHARRTGDCRRRSHSFRCRPAASDEGHQIPTGRHAGYSRKAP
jgi:SRSO17 transposase